MTLEEAINHPNRKYTPRTYDLIYDGKHWNARQLADELGVRRNWLYGQLNRFVSMSDDEKTRFQKEFQITVELKEDDIHS